MNHLRDSVRLRAYGQQDPLIEYKREGHKMFRHLLDTIDAVIAKAIMKADITVNQKPTRGPSSGNSPRTGLGSNKVGRNDPGPCGSNKKFRKCCMLK